MYVFIYVEANGRLEDKLIFLPEDYNVFLSGIHCPAFCHLLYTNKSGCCCNPSYNCKQSVVNLSESRSTNVYV